MELLLDAIKMDWPVLLPILVCSILAIGVIINRWTYYNANKREVGPFIQKLSKELANNNLINANNIAIQCGGIYGELTEEAVRIYTDQRKGFSRSFDISSSLAVKKLEDKLPILGTIGGVAPFLGLFGTVVRILYTFQDLAVQGNQSAAVATGIGSALIATAFGLGVAILAVIFYNAFQNTVKDFESNFQLIKLLFLSFADSEEEQFHSASNSGLKV